MNRLANIKAFLDTVAWSEIGPRLLHLSDNGYNVLVGSTPNAPLLFDSYVSHPRRHNEATNSDAAGRYQFMGRFWPAYQKSMNLPDFGPDSQDKWAIQLIRECHAYDDIAAGNIEDAIRKCAARWMSFPGAGFHQRQNQMVDLLRAYRLAGGGVAP